MECILLYIVSCDLVQVDMIKLIIWWFYIIEILKSIACNMQILKCEHFQCDINKVELSFSRL